MLPHPEIIAASEVGHVLLVDDGKIKLTVTGTLHFRFSLLTFLLHFFCQSMHHQCDLTQHRLSKHVNIIGKGDGYLECLVANEGKISNRKGVNTPDSVLDISPLTPKDRSDLEYMLSIGVDWVALSFVQRKEDIEEIHKLIDQWLPEGAFKPAVMAKIEKPSCFVGTSLHDIVKLCDGIMVARGDLGVECAPEDVPLLQKEIIDECRLQGKPVVVATQMLESMIDSPTPTRAEASDVATAIYDGADAIMLSAESAAGKVR
jgi:pyruvate kinase